MGSATRGKDMKRKFVKTDYNQVILREGDKIIHLDAEALAELYWEVQDGKLERVVRCKDCKHYNYVTTRINPDTIIERKYDWMECEMNENFSPYDDFFCEMGEKRNDGETYMVKEGVQIKI